MPKQKSTTSRSSSRGWESRSVSKGRSSRSATPASKAAQNEAQPKLKLKIRLNNRGANTDPHAAGQEGQSTTYNHHLSACAALPPPVTTRTGRAVHAPQHADTIQGNEYDHLMGIRAKGSGDGDNVIQPSLLDDHSRIPGNMQRYSPYRSSNARQQNASVSRQFGIKGDRNWPCPAFEPSQDVYDIVNNLQRTTTIPLDLPSLSNAADPDLIQPYSPQLLTHLYLTCYERKLWNLCDMIADTWIRAFHARRKKSHTAAEHQLWRRNKALEQRQRKAYEAWRNGVYMPSEFDPSPRHYGLEASDPDVAPDVTNMHLDLLNTLYEHTAPDCGARMLWADALALAGDYTEKSIDVAHKRGLQLHHDLLFNVMQTSLRLVRRNLTLKIEETTEGAWCRRYHEHGKHGLPCYRELAAKSKGSGGDGLGEEAYQAFLEDESEARVRDGQGLGDKEHDRRHVSFGHDIDAEGDSVEE